MGAPTDSEKESQGDKTPREDPTATTDPTAIKEDIPYGDKTPKVDCKKKEEIMEKTMDDSNGISIGEYAKTPERRKSDDKTSEDTSDQNTDKKEALPKKKDRVKTSKTRKAHQIVDME